MYLPSLQTNPGEPNEWREASGSKILLWNDGSHRLLSFGSVLVAAASGQSSVVRYNYGRSVRDEEKQSGTGGGEEGKDEVCYRFFSSGFLKQERKLRIQNHADPATCPFRTLSGTFETNAPVDGFEEKISCDGGAEKRMKARGGVG